MASKRTLRLRRVRAEVSMVESYPLITGETVIFYSDTPRQVRCLIHGQDLHPSARIYPDSGMFYCHGCKLSLNSLSYYMNYNGFEFSDYRDVEEMLLFFEDSFNLEQYPLEKYLKDTDDIDIETTIDYKAEFQKLWLEVNNLSCSIKGKSRESIFGYLDKAWETAMGPKNKARKGWRFLFKLKDTYKEEFDSLD